jgi:hypothetical protein
MIFRVLNAVVCDIVRPEAAAKYACLGIYPKGAVGISDFTLPLYLAFFLDIESDQKAKIDAHFILENRQSNRVFSSFSNPVDLDGALTTPLYTPPMAINVDGPSWIHFSAIAGGEKIELATAYIFKGNATG